MHLGLQTQYTGTGTGTGQVRIIRECLGLNSKWTRSQELPARGPRFWWNSERQPSQAASHAGTCSGMGIGTWGSSQPRSQPSRSDRPRSQWSRLKLGRFLQRGSWCAPKVTHKLSCKWWSAWGMYVVDGKHKRWLCLAVCLVFRQRDGRAVLAACSETMWRL